MPSIKPSSFGPNIKIKSIWTTYTRTKSISTPSMNQVDLILHAKIKFVSMLQHKSQVVPIPTLKRTNFRHLQTKSSQFWCLQWNRVKFDPPSWNQVNSKSHTQIEVISTTHTKIKLASTPTTKLSLFRSRFYRQFSFDTPTENQVNFYSDTKPSRFRPLHKKLIPILTLNPG